MTSIQYLEEQVKQLTPIERQEFREWFLEWNADDWDRQIEQDAQAGKLDAFAPEAILEKRAKHGSREQFLEILSRASDGEPEEFDSL